MIVRPALRRLAFVLMAAAAAGPGVALASRDVALAARGAGSPVTIGLFVPVRGPQAALGTDVLRGAEIAVAQARRESGARGRPLRLVTAPSDLRWEASTGALVRLLYEEGAVAVVGALDGRSAHLAEQVITRARGRAVFVTPWASESNLTRIRIPWFFSVVPDDLRQAAALAGEIFSGRRAGRAAAWVEEAFDCRAAADAFVEAAPPGTVVRFSAGDANGREDLAARIRRGEFGALVLFAAPRAAADLSSWLRRTGAGLPLFGPLSLAVPEFLAHSEGAAEGMLIVAPGTGGTRAERAFDDEFARRHGVPPSSLARYSHDAVAAVVAALRQAEAGRAGRLEEALAATVIEGATGTVRFDERRGREGWPALEVVRPGGDRP